MKTISIVLPIYNEGDRIYRAFKALESYRAPRGITVETVRFVDDGSQDNTARQVRAWIKAIVKKKRYLPIQSVLRHASIELVSYRKNRGRGYAVRQGAKGFTSDYMLYLDADMSIPLRNLKQCIPYMQEGIDCIAGSKKIKGTVALHKGSWLRGFVGKAHTQLLQFVLGVNFYDFTGGFKLFSKELYTDIFPKLCLDRWGFDPEIIYVAQSNGYTLKEVPIVWSHVSTSSKVQLVRDITWALGEMVAIRINDLLGKYSRKEKSALINWMGNERIVYNKGL